MDSKQHQINSWRRLKKRIGPIDDKFLGGRIRKFYEFSPIVRFIADSIGERPLRNHRRKFFGHGFEAQYHKNDESLINQLCDKYGTNKGEASPEGNPYSMPSHNYADLYDLLFRMHRHEVRLLVECGIAHGASLRMWRDYFPKARILGFDVVKEYLFTEERIETFLCDQTSPESIAEFVRKSNLQVGSVNVIIDDGLHEFHAGVSLFEGLNKYLADSGFYIVEDVMPEDYRAYKDYFAERSSEFTAHFINLNRPGQRIWLNRLLVIMRSN